MITGMYELMEEFNVQAPPQDLALFQTLGPAAVQCRNAIDKSVSERDTNVTKLATLIDKDIEELEKEVKSIKQDVQDGSILDINTDQEKIKAGFQMSLADVDKMALFKLTLNLLTNERPTFLHQFENTHLWTLF